MKSHFLLQKIRKGKNDWSSGIRKNAYTTHNNNKTKYKNSGSKAGKSKFESITRILSLLVLTFNIYIDRMCKTKKNLAYIFSRTIPLAWEAPPKGLALYLVPKCAFL